MRYVRTFAQYLPHEAARITGVDEVMQRDWRRRGILPSGDGKWRRFEPEALAEMLVLRELGKCGIGPANAKETAHWAAPGVLYQAFQRPESIVDETGGEIFERYGRTVRSAERRAVAEAGGVAEFVVRSLTKVIPAGRYVVLWPDGEEENVDSLDDAFGRDPSDPRCSGAAVVLDLRALGSTLLDRTGGGLVVVDKDPRDDPLAGGRKVES